MKSFTAVCLLALVAVVCGKSVYTDRYDSINVDEITGNRRLLIPYIKCVLGLDKCTPEGRELKSHIREALEENCSSCTEAQKIGARKVLSHLINHEKDYWDQLVTKYDPHHKYAKKYEKELSNINRH